jgi:type I site-specific restriction-modification system R (restriction) subunit
MTRPKNVRTDRVWLRDDFNDALDKFDEEQKLGAFVYSTPNGSAIEQYLRHERKDRENESYEPEYRFFYDASSQKADYLAVVRMEKYPTVIRHTVENVTPDEAKTIDALTASALRWSPAQFGWAVAELEIERQSKLDSAE